MDEKARYYLGGKRGQEAHELGFVKKVGLQESRSVEVNAKARNRYRARGQSGVGLGKGRGVYRRKGSVCVKTHKASTSPRQLRGVKGKIIMGIAILPRAFHERCGGNLTEDSISRSGSGVAPLFK